ncbi:MAG: outer membrane protein assembly factor BamD [Micavibrio aeruginosavorus]|uniref:Outer membrane protein assembly factor BamD n=1 Tax=Micavibrio aeruginosavorus TaxID=349221 RepID=A0A2W5QB87_9BACT|nr:MAG: outer membrane protein assembly factor BamD [Micavibrio aeruginosavorus]
MLKKLLLSLVCLTLLAACSSDKDAKDKAQQEKPVEELYNGAQKALKEENYKEATRLFEEVERQHPYSQWATKAQLMAAYSAYQGDNYDDAILALDRFIELHPGSEDIDYAYYLKALAYYEQISDVARDQGLTQQALEAFNTLVQRFPDSKYARDAKLKMDLTNDHLAGKEMEIGRYYLNRGQTNAAINRFLKVVKDYQTTTHTPEALHRLVECYLSLGLYTEAERVAAVLGYNYPGSKWYQDTYNIIEPERRKEVFEGRSTWDKTIDSLFRAD